MRNSKYTKEFKDSTIQLVFNNNESVAKIATVIDLYSRKVVGWSMDDTMKVSLVNDALSMAIKHRNPPKGLLWHTDRGSQYASYSHKDLLQHYGIVQSMSRKGNCWDNAVADGVPLEGRASSKHLKVI